MDLNKYLNNVAPSEPQYSKEEYAAMKKTEREAVWVQVDARMGEVLADAPALQEFLNFMSQCRNSLPNQLLLSGQNADITDARTFQQWKDAGRHIRTGEEGYTAIVGQVYENNGRKASGYNIGKVFDITQTRGRPVPPPANYQVDELVAAAIESSPQCRSKSRTVCQTASKRSMFPRTARFMSATAWMQARRCAPSFGSAHRQIFTRITPTTAKPTLRRVTVPPTWSRIGMGLTPPLSTLTAWLPCTAIWAKNSSGAF